MHPHHKMGEGRHRNKPQREEPQEKPDCPPSPESSRVEEQTQDVNNGDNRPRVVVGIGASAGGVEALESLFAEMPGSTGAAFVIVQHLAPNFESLMDEILARKSCMPVSKIVDGIELEANHVYVLPNGFYAQVNGSSLATFDSMGERTNKPIDDFLCSLAESFNENGIGIILSGTGSDGAVGVEKIHDHGGLVIVQSESSAKFNGMPRAAIATGVSDVILAVEEIPATLCRFLDGSRERGSRHAVFSESMDAEKRILDLLHRKFGIDFDYYKRGMFTRRLTRRMELSGAAGIETYLQQVEAEPSELKLLYGDLLIGVTEFFRDPNAFNELQNRVLPAQIEAAATSGTFRVWVAPCATGEEAYSIAILIDELVRQRNYDINVKIFATDVNESCIDTAGRGVFTKEHLANVSERRLSNYFRQKEDGYQIIPRLRRQIVFAKQNVLLDPPFTKLDLICCRNLLIYFNDEAKKKLLSLFNFSMNSSGVLFLGSSETVTELDEAFLPISKTWQLYRKNTQVPFSQVDMSLVGSSSAPKTQRTPRLSNSDLQQKELSSVYDTLLGTYMPQGILVDEQNKVLHVFGKATQFLQHRAGRPTDDILELLPESPRLVIQSGLKRARIEDRPAVFPGVEMESTENDSGNYKVTIMPVHNRYSRKFLVTFEPTEPTKPPVAIVGDSELNEESTVLELRSELEDMRQSLHESILNLRSANEEMQTTNEELIASNEELQSTNEELHSVNEELFTVNTEHQRKITELTELTDDMDNLLDCLQIDTIYLDRRLRVRKFTLGIANIFRLLPQDIGRDFGSFNHGLNHDDIIELMQQVLATESGIDEEVEDCDGNWYLMRLLPYTSRGRTDGVLLTLIDITSMKLAKQKLAELSEIVQASDDAVFRISAEGEIRTWNRGAQSLFLHEAENIVGKCIDVLSLDPQSAGMVSNSLDQLKQGRNVGRIELKAARRNGEEFIVQSTISPIYTDDGTFDGSSIILRDITAQKKAEAQIHEQVHRRDQFLAMLSHELRNPISAITNALSVARKEPIEDNRLAKAIEIIRQQSSQLGKMLDDLLHVSRITHNKFKLQLQTTDIGATAKNIVDSLQHRINAKRQSLILEIPDTPLFALVDETRIVQAQTNLLVNACKYTPENGCLKYSVWKEEDSVVIEISDDGEGMSPELLERIFEVFVQAEQLLDRSSGGMGLGLPLVKMIASAHGGSVEAKSAGPGLGSSLRLQIPIGNIASASGVEAEQASVTLDGLKLLLVEDNDGAREMLAEYLEMEGAVVATAANGIDGVEQFKKLSPDICVVDIGLPDLNGYEVARRIVATGQPTLLVALTGYGQDQDRINAKSAGFAHHFVKPIDPELLLGKLAAEYHALNVEPPSAPLPAPPVAI